MITQNSNTIIRFNDDAPGKLVINGVELEELSAENFEFNVSDFTLPNSIGDDFS